MKNTYIFNPEKSKDLTGDEIVIIPHPLIIMPSLTLVAAKQEAMLPTFSKAIKILLNDPKDPFLKVSVKNILFDGIHVNCTVSDPEVKMVCKMLKSELKEVTNETLNFSLFGAKNNTDLPGLLTVKRGVKIFRQTGRVVQFNGQTKLNVWGSKGTCNSILGTDSTIFPPFQPDDEEIYTFSPDICTSLQSKLQKKIMYKGVLVGRYNTSLGDMSHNKDQKCYCPAKNYCLKRGAIDITKCVNSTLVVTLPHFYDADVSYLRAVSGLNPNEESHGTYMNFEMNTGSPVYAVKRLQFNIPIRPIKTMFLMENFSDILLPIFWIEESIELNETYVKSFRSLHKVIKIADIVKWSATTLFGGGLFISVVMMYVVEVLSFDKERYNEQNSPDFSSDETTPRELSAKWKMVTPKTNGNC